MDTNPGEGEVKESETKAAVEQLEETQVVESRDRTARWLTFLSSLAEVVSWLILVLMIAVGIYSTWGVLQNMRGASVDQIILSLASSGLYTILMGLFYFVVLQAVAKGINIVLDIRDNLEYLVADEEE